MPTNAIAENTTPKPMDAGWAWARFEPDGQRAWTLRWAGHLYRRAAFGASWQQLQDALKAGPQATIDGLVKPSGVQAGADASSGDDAVTKSGEAGSLAAWWLRRMLETPYPLREKMAMFWHGHFGISQARVKDGRLMANHVSMLRKHALGSYRDLLQAAWQDPAMFLGLNAEASRRAMPNDNFARQLLGNLSLGPGACDEQDIKEAARAFTGWFVLRGDLRYFEREHDTGVKTVLAQKGAWKPEDIVRIVLEHGESARSIVRKIYRWLISEVEEPEETLLKPLVDSFAQSYDVGQLVETMLRSNLFFSETAYRRRIKSPVEFALGIARGMESIVPTLPLGSALANLGQQLGDPPTVQGWPGGRHWISPATLTGRLALADAMLAPEGAYAGKLNAGSIARKHNSTNPDSAAGFFCDLWLQGDVSDAVRKGLKEAASAAKSPADDAWFRDVANRVIRIPEFQLS